MNEKNSKNDKQVNDEIDLVELFFILWNRKLFIILFTFLISLLTAIHQFYIAKEIFRSDAVILPVSSSGSSDLLSRLGGLASFVGVNASKSENTIELFLNSRSFAQEMVNNLKLNERWKCSFQKAVQTFQMNLEVSSSNMSSEIVISWEDEEPEFAKKIIEKVLKLIENKMAEYAVKKQNRQVQFLQNRVKDALVELNNSELALQKFQESYQSIEVERQAQAIIAQLSKLRAKKEEQELELSVVKKVLSRNDGKVKIIEHAVDELKKRIDELIGISKKELDTSMVERTLMDIPKIGLEYARCFRKVRINQKIYSLLLEQFEMAKIEVQKEIESFEVIDNPIISENKIRPKRSITLIISCLVSFIMSVTYIMLIHFVYNIRNQRLK